jgi:hypothetical protein
LWKWGFWKFDVPDIFIGFHEFNSSLMLMERQFLAPDDAERSFVLSTL